MTEALLPWPATVCAGAAPWPVTGVPRVVLDGTDSAGRALAVDRFRDRFARRSGRHAPGQGTLAIRCPADPASDQPRDSVDEAYRLVVHAGGVDLTAPHWCGINHGLETLLQLVRHDLDGVVVPALEINDRPRFVWRGLMLDLCRHWLPLPALLDTLDGMAAAKLNVLHLHLTEDQAFRVHAPSLPELTANGANGQFLAPDDVRTLVAHAGARGIRVVPEFDLPGHVGAWLVAHPELAARPSDAPFALRTAFGVSRAAMDPGKPAVLQLLGRFFDDMLDLFPDSHVHIGGDEVHPDAWQGLAHIDAFMAQHGLADHAALQAWFSNAVAGLLRSRGRRAVVWDEALHADLAPDVLVQGWRGAAMEQAARAAGRELLSSSGWYLDLNWPAASHLAWDPAGTAAEQQAAEAALDTVPGAAQVAAGLGWFRGRCREAAAAAPAPAVAPGAVLGGEACLWSELVTAPLLANRLWGRLPAVAERLWSAELPDAGAFASRMAAWQACTGRQPDPRPLLAQLGLVAAQQQTLAGFLDALAPLRWYGRHLGDPGLAGRVAEREPDAARRPYSVLTPLDRLVDMADPDPVGPAQAERLVAALVRQATAPEAEQDPELAAELQHWAEQWRQGALLVLDLAEDLAALAEVEPLAERLLALLEVLDEALELLEEVAPEDWPDGLPLPAGLPPGSDEALAPVAELHLVAAVPVLRLVAALGIDGRGLLAADPDHD